MANRAAVAFSLGVAFVVAAASPACSSDPECPHTSDGPCPSGCGAGEGIRYDRAKDCLPSRSTIVSCDAPDIRTSDAACQIREDGVVFIGSGSLGFPRCDEALRTAVQENGRTCP